MIQASGCCFLALDTGRIMLQQRSKRSSHPLTWSFWGGKAKKDERPIETLLRECREEIGILPDIAKVHPLHTFLSDDDKFTYNTYCVTVFEEFIPSCNHESSGYSWVSIDCWPKPLHRGAKVVLSNKQLVDKLVTIYERERDQTDLPNWLDSF
tara:strand:- start:1052 stop:1510 length:459 start_codon:yes stop_codon:yes gene_type:complete